MKLYFAISLLVVSAFSLLTACENEGGSTNNAPNDTTATEQQKPIIPIKPAD